MKTKTKRIKMTSKTKRSKNQLIVFLLMENICFIWFEFKKRTNLVEKPYDPPHL